jgi:hypothetical protein
METLSTALRSRMKARIKARIKTEGFITWTTLQVTLRVTQTQYQAGWGGLGFPGGIKMGVSF